MSDTSDIDESEIFADDALYAEAFLLARKNEIFSFEKAIEESNNVSTIFQRLPTHMRRRAMSHNVKRMPRYLRSAHQRQLEKNKVKKKLKCPRRKFRRRPNNLLNEYNRRQRTSVWLETHIWHAKRFRMLSKWGYKVADSACNKIFRASYRAISSHCLVQDISYYCCIELQGTLSDLLDRFKTISSSECGLTIGAKCWLNGDREGTTFLFHKNCYPYRVIGKINFIWKPSNDSTGKRTVWIWCHPAFYEELVNVFLDIFNLKNIQELRVLANESGSEISKDTDKELIKLSLKNVPFVRTPKYYNNETDISMILLKDTLNRFRLTGPLSNSVLTSAFREPFRTNENIVKISDDLLCRVESKQAKINAWWNEFRSNNNIQNYIMMFKGFNCSSQFPPHSVIGGVTVDPRLFLPRQKNKALPGDAGQFISKPLENWCHSEIWNSEVRDMCTSSKLSTAMLNKLRSNLLVARNDQHLCSMVKAVIPVLLIQRPGDALYGRIGFGAGWDIILPAGWGMPTWMSLILNGARPGALRETRTINFESKIMPEFPPDSKAGSIHYKTLEETSVDRYFRLPPNKRVNYAKLGFPTPFSYPWKQLLRDWKTDQCVEDSENFFVLRNWRCIQLLIDDVKNVRFKQNTFLTLSRCITDRNCLLPVSVKMINSGKLTSFSHICLPLANDLTDMLKCGGGKTRSNNKCPVEKLHKDKNCRVRQRVRRDHQLLLKFLRKERKKKRHEQKSKENSGEQTIRTKRIRRKESPTSDLVKECHLRLRELWIPSEHTGSIRYHCDREIMGFVVCAGFSFIESCTIGQGYVSLNAFISLMELHHSVSATQMMVLTRSPTTRNYRYCKISICGI